MSNASAKIDEVMLNLKLDSKIAITWFIDNGMEPHPEKFQFMVMSNNVIDTHTLELDDTTKLRSQSDIVLLGIKIDDKLTFAIQRNLSSIALLTVTFSTHPSYGFFVDMSTTTKLRKYGNDL